MEGINEVGVEGGVKNLSWGMGLGDLACFGWFTCQQLGEINFDGVVI